MTTIFKSIKRDWQKGKCLIKRENIFVNMYEFQKKFLYRFSACECFILILMSISLRLFCQFLSKFKFNSLSAIIWSWTMQSKVDRKHKIIWVIRPSTSIYIYIYCIRSCNESANVLLSYLIKWKVPHVKYLAKLKGNQQHCVIFF